MCAALLFVIRNAKLEFLLQPNALHLSRKDFDLFLHQLQYIDWFWFANSSEITIWCPVWGVIKMISKILEISCFNQCPLEGNQIPLRGFDKCLSCGVFHIKGFYTIVCLFASDWKYKFLNHEISYLIKYCWVTSTDSYCSNFFNPLTLLCLNNKWSLVANFNFSIGSAC